MPGRRAIPPAEPPVEPVRMIGDHKVIADEPLPSPLPTGPGQSRKFFTGLRQLTLDNGDTMIGCGSCDFAGTRGQVMRHRSAAHGTGRRPGRSPGRSPGRPASEPAVSGDLALMPLGEVLALIRDAGQWGDAFGALEEQARTWKDRALAAEAWRRRVTGKLAQLGFKLDDEEED